MQARDGFVTETRRWLRKIDSFIPLVPNLFGAVLGSIGHGDTTTLLMPQTPKDDLDANFTDCLGSLALLAKFESISTALAPARHR